MQVRSAPYLSESHNPKKASAVPKPSSVSAGDVNTEKHTVQTDGENVRGRDEEHREAHEAVSDRTVSTQNVGITGVTDDTTVPTETELPSDTA